MITKNSQKKHCLLTIIIIKQKSVNLRNVQFVFLNTEAPECHLILAEDRGVRLTISQGATVFVHRIPYD